jgi:hypothetical protein
LHCLIQHAEVVHHGGHRRRAHSVLVPVRIANGACFLFYKLACVVVFGVIVPVVLAAAAAPTAAAAAAAHAIVCRIACEHPYPTRFHNMRQELQKLEGGEVSRLDLFALNWIFLDDAKVPDCVIIVFTAENKETNVKDEIHLVRSQSCTSTRCVLIRDK